MKSLQNYKVRLDLGLTRREHAQTSIYRQSIYKVLYLLALYFQKCVYSMHNRL